MLTLGLVMGTYSLADHLGMSGPIAVVVAGLLIGNHEKSFSLPAETSENLGRVWELIEEILNAVLFVLIGLEMLAMHYTARHLAAAVLAIPIVLAARWLSVVGTIKALLFKRRFSPAMVSDIDVGRIAGRTGDCDGAVAAERGIAEFFGGGDLWGGDVLDPGAGDDDSEAGAVGAEGRKANGGGGECLNASVPKAVR